MAKGKEKIGLVLALITAAFQQISTGVFILFHTREVAGGNLVGPELVGTLNESAKLEVLVAHHAGVGCATGFVFVGEILDDVFLEVFRFINEVVADAEVITNGTGIHDRLRSATFIFRRGKHNPAAII